MKQEHRGPVFKQYDWCCCIYAMWSSRYRKSSNVARNNNKMYIKVGSWRQRQETNETKNGNKCNGNNNESKKEEKKIRHAYTFGKRQKEEKTMNKTKGTSQQHQQSNISGTKESEWAHTLARSHKNKCMKKNIKQKRLRSLTHRTLTHRREILRNKCYPAKDQCSQSERARE